MGFSVAEAMVTLLIVSLVMAASAPILTKRNKSVGVDYERLREQIVQEVKDEFRSELVPENTIAFFASDCPTAGWTPVDANWIGRYPKIVSSAGEIGLEAQSILRHKHISPYHNVGRGCEDDLCRYFRRFGFYQHENNLVGGAFMGGISLWNINQEVFTSDGTSQVSLHETEVNPNADVKIVDSAISADEQPIIVGDENRPKTIKLVACKKLPRT